MFRKIGKISATIIFVLFFLVFLAVGTVRFEVLNSEFVFASLQRNHIYEDLPQAFGKSLPNDPNLKKDESAAYASIAQSISPKTIQKFVEDNLGNVYDFINGRSNDIVIHISGKELGLPVKDISWSLSQNVPPQAANRFDILKGLGNILIGVFVILGVMLFLLYLAAGNAALLTVGVITLILGAGAKLFLWSVAANTPAKEPSQVLLLFLSKSVLTDITTTWIVIGVGLILLFIILKLFKKKKGSKRVSKLPRKG